MEELSVFLEGRDVDDRGRWLKAFGRRDPPPGPLRFSISPRLGACVPSEILSSKLTRNSRSSAIWGHAEVCGGGRSGRREADPRGDAVTRSRRKQYAGEVCIREMWAESPPCKTNPAWPVLSGERERCMYCTARSLHNLNVEGAGE